MSLKITTADTTAGLELPTAADASFGNAYEINISYLLAAQYREEYLRLYTLLQELGKVNAGGVREITLTGHNGSSVTVPLFAGDSDTRGGSLYSELYNVLGNRLATLEKNIWDYEQMSQENEPQEREGMGRRSVAFNYCLPMRRMSDAEFAALPAQARRTYDEERAERLEAA